MLKWTKEAKKISGWRPNGIKGNVMVPPFLRGKKKKARRDSIKSLLNQDDEWQLL